MECLKLFASVGYIGSSSRLSTTRVTSKPKIISSSRANLRDQEGDDDLLLQAAVDAATTRFQESLRPEPLFLDPYAACLLPPNFSIESKQNSNNNRLATKFIDDLLLSTMSQIDGFKQVVLLSDGMDTRPYRLRWPSSTLIFDISPVRVFKKACKELEAAGAKIPRSCLLRHVPFESLDIDHALRAKGFNGNSPSIWAIQGLPILTLTSFKEILRIVSSLAMKGCFLLGELVEGQNKMTKSCSKNVMNKIFMSCGFRVKIVEYDEVALRWGELPGLDDSNSVLFVAEHLRFSDDQMEIWRNELKRIEDEGDEEGFEEM